MMTTIQRRLHAIVTGVVQGVSFRHYTRAYAQQVGAVGWVRNLPTGAVEVLAEGTPSTLDHLLTFLRRGPTEAQVDEVQVEWLAATGEFAHFEVRW